MVTISATWRINGNGSQGLLTLASNDNVSLNGSIKFDDTGERTDAVEGVWDDAASKITLTRFLPGGVTQTFTGFLGDNHAENLILAGSITDSVNPGISSGWVAAPLQPPATYVLSLGAFHGKQARYFFSIPQATATAYAALNVQVLSQGGYR